MNKRSAHTALRLARLGPEPAGLTVCKFIIIENSQESVLVFGPVAAYRYHAALISAFCDREEIPAAWIKKPDQVEIYDDQWEVRGGGWLEIDVTSKRVEFYGYSTAYGKYRDRDIRRFLDGHTFFSGFTLSGLD